MKFKKMRSWLHVLIIISILALFLAGCENENGKDTTPTPTVTEEPTTTPTSTLEAEYPDEAPPLPPSFEIDFDAFSSSDEESFLPNGNGYTVQFASFSQTEQPPFAKQALLGDRSNFNYAAGTVLIWSTIGVIGLAVPVTAFNASFYNIPLQQDDGSWIWSYSVRISGLLYTAELHGIYIPDGVRWEMYISKEGGYSDFLWFYGESDRPVTEGYWILKNTPAEPTDLLRIDWTRTIADGTGSIKYTNIVPDGPENGGYIYTETNTNTPYNAYWDIYNKGQDNHTYIEWNRTTLEGRVKDFNHFKDDNWHCWDSQRTNVVCP